MAVERRGVRLQVVGLEPVCHQVVGRLAGDLRQVEHLAAEQPLLEERQVWEQGQWDCPELREDQVWRQGRHLELAERLAWVGWLKVRMDQSSV